MIKSCHPPRENQEYLNFNLIQIQFVILVVSRFKKNNDLLNFVILVDNNIVKFVLLIVIIQIFPFSGNFKCIVC